MLFAIDHQAGTSDLLDRRLGDVDKPYMRLVIGLIITGIDTQPFATEDIVGRQQGGGRRILDSLADLAPGELGDGVVGFLLEQQIPIGAKKRQPAAAPGFLVLLLAFLRRGVES